MAEEKQGMLERAKEAVKAAGKRVAEGNREGLGALLDKMIGRQKKTDMKNAAQPMAHGAVGEVDEELMNEITRYGQEHPELQEQYPDFDSLAEHYIRDIKPNMGYVKTISVRPIRRDEKLMENVEPITVEKKTIDVEPITTEQFLDRLTRK